MTTNEIAENGCDINANVDKPVLFQERSKMTTNEIAENGCDINANKPGLFQERTKMTTNEIPQNGCDINANKPGLFQERTKMTTNEIPQNGCDINANKPGLFHERTKITTNEIKQNGSDIATDGMEEKDSWLETASPVEVRRYYRENNGSERRTTGLCKGYFQANVVLLHKSIAGNFSKFCHANPGPLPIVFQSEVGQFSAPKISKDSDIRTDLGMYEVFENGIHVATVKDLMKFSGLSDYVAFYEGCSYSFDWPLLANGVPLRYVEQNCDATCYTTNVAMHPIGEFGGPMVVSMRPIPKELVEKAYRITHPMGDYHGAPIHIGDAAVIGIDMMKPDVGKPNLNRFHDGDVAVFWACGVSASQAICSAKPSLAFTHCPSYMYISDMKVDMSQLDTTNTSDLPVVISLQETPYLASVASQATVDKIKKLEQLAVEDPGKRQITNQLIEADLLKSAMSLSHSSSVAITVGTPFVKDSAHPYKTPCVQDNAHPYSTDGISGAIAIASIMQTLGKKAALVVEKGLFALMKQIVKVLLEKGLIKQDILVEQYPSSNNTASLESAKSFLTQDDDVTPRYDHIVAIKRTGQSSDGKHYTMNARDISSLVESSDYLFEAAKELPRVYTTGIGDFGNELGMGKVYDQVVKSVPYVATIACKTSCDYLITCGLSDLGEFALAVVRWSPASYESIGDGGATIGCKTSCDYLITCGLCDWGGFALAVAVCLLKLCPIHDRYQRRACGYPPSDEEKAMLKDALPSVEKERKVLEVLLQYNFRDGRTGGSSMTVDSVPYDDIKQMLAI